MSDYEENLKKSKARLEREYPIPYGTMFPKIATQVEDRHSGSGFIARNAYDIRRDAFKTCLSCGSKTQPCCGH